MSDTVCFLFNADDRYLGFYDFVYSFFLVKMDIVMDLSQNRFNIAVNKHLTNGMMVANNLPITTIIPLD